MSLDAFNALDRDEARAAVRACVDIDRWVDAVVSARPYATVEYALRVAREAAPAWSEGEIDGALAHHPRIGASVSGEDLDATLSRAEQAGIDPTDAGVQAALAAGNAAYEEKFDRVFLIRAAGRSTQEILEALTARMTNSPDAEILIVAEQLREIALLRFEGELTR